MCCWPVTSQEIAALSQFRKNLAQAKSLTASAATQLEKHEPDAALQDLEAALKLCKENPVAYYLRGLAYLQKDSFEQGRANLQKALEIKPDYPEAHNSLGRVLWQLGDRQGAVAEFDKATALAPDFAEAHFNRGLAALLVGMEESGTGTIAGLTGVAFESPRRTPDLRSCLAS
jgi:tetratricopeptide (TPR) repeat protein